MMSYSKKQHAEKKLKILLESNFGTVFVILRGESRSGETQYITLHSLCGGSLVEINLHVSRVLGLSLIGGILKVKGDSWDEVGRNIVNALGNHLGKKLIYELV